MNIFYHILASTSHLMDRYECYDVGIHEIHHKGKADSPSGTALSLGQIVLQNSRRKKNVLTETSRKEIKPEQLHITSTRIGHVVGRHSVLFDSEADSIELVPHREEQGRIRAGRDHGGGVVEAKKRYIYHERRNHINIKSYEKNYTFPGNRNRNRHAVHFNG